MTKQTLNYQVNCLSIKWKHRPLNPSFSSLKTGDLFSLSSSTKYFYNQYIITINKYWHLSPVFSINNVKRYFLKTMKQLFQDKSINKTKILIHVKNNLPTNRFLLENRIIMIIFPYFELNHIKLQHSVSFLMSICIFSLLVIFISIFHIKRIKKGLRR